MTSGFAVTIEIPAGLVSFDSCTTIHSSAKLPREGDETPVLSGDWNY